MKNIYTINKSINWRKEKGIFILLHPVLKKLLFFNPKISKNVTDEGLIIEDANNQSLVKKLLKEKIISKTTSDPNMVDNKEKGQISAPLNVTLQITNRCNLKCVHCHRLYKNIETMKLRDFKNLAKDLRSMNVFNINFSGGEPCLVSDFPKMVAFANRLGIKTTASTNNTLMTSSLAKTLKSNGLDVVHISLDSSDPQKHDKIRGGVTGAYFKMTSNLEYLQKNKIEYIFVTTLLDQRLKDYEKIIDLAYDLGAYGHKTNTVITQGRAENKKIDYYRNPLLIDKYISIWQKKKKQYQGKMKVIAETMFEMQIDERSQGAFNTKCPAGILTCAINENGDVIPCSFFSNQIVGNVFKQGFKKIWTKSSKLKKIRKMNCRKCKAINEKLSISV